MTALPVSVVVVSRNRPEALKRCLTGISQQAGASFEVIVVADQAGQAAVDDLEFAGQVKRVVFDEANISLARNLGLAQAAGDVVAFIDDDAVPETRWLMHLVAPFADPEVAAAGGYVRGRNGISFQWTAQSVDRTGRAVPLTLKGSAPMVLHPREGRAIKTEGTNMAFRRDLLAEMGGFDPAYRYFLDETDLNMRLAAAGHSTAIVPLAEVHHGYLENAQRTANRAPRDLSEIGASLAVYLRKFCPHAERPGIWKRFQEEQRSRLVRYMVAGDLMPGDVGRLMRGLRSGYVAGRERPMKSLRPVPRAAEGFKAFASRGGTSQVLAGRIWQRWKLRRKAEAALTHGRVPSVFVFSPTTLFHHVRYRMPGYWEQSGGLFGRSERGQKVFRMRLFGLRLKEEVARVAQQRGLRDE